MESSTNFEEYTKLVTESRLSLEKTERYFYRADPNQKNEYATAFQVGIGNEEEKLIDIHIAKVWREGDAKNIVDKLNSEIIPF